jgi:hypothetical protein
MPYIFHGAIDSQNWDAAKVANDSFAYYRAAQQSSNPAQIAEIANSDLKISPTLYLQQPDVFRYVKQDMLNTAAPLDEAGHYLDKPTLMRLYNQDAQSVDALLKVSGTNGKLGEVDSAAYQFFSDDPRRYMDQSLLTLRQTNVIATDAEYNTLKAKLDADFKVFNSKTDGNISGSERMLAHLYTNTLPTATKEALEGIKQNLHLAEAHYRYYHPNTAPKVLN